ncbi:MAG TPA: hypothetical protein VGG99_00785 [Acetobacteraceae bacterium]|jgi:hypothetical protein
MHWVHLVKRNPAENMCKFFDLYIASDVLDGLSLCVARGRMGRTPIVTVHSSGAEDVLLGNLCSQAKIRLRHGYVLDEANVPLATRQALEAYSRSRRRIFSTTRAGSRSIFFDIGALSSLGGPGSAQDPFVRALDRFSQMVDPQRGQKSRRGGAQEGSETADLFQAIPEPVRFGTVSSDERREILRGIASVILEDDPRTRAAVMRALSPPSHVTGDNVVFFAARKSRSRRATNVSLFDVLSDRPDHAQIAHVLAEGGIRTLADVVAYEPELLRSRFGLRHEELRVLDAQCGKYGYQLGMMREVRQSGSPRQANGLRPLLLR